MSGSIRAGVGFMMVFGAVGGMEVDPDASLLLLGVLAVLGLALMQSGVSAMNKKT